MYLSKKQLEFLGEPLGDMTLPKKQGGYICHGGGKSSAPPTPDYIGAANATAAGNLQAAQYATQANRVNQYTPYGNLVYTGPTSNPTLSNQGTWNSAQGLTPGTSPALLPGTPQWQAALTSTPNTQPTQSPQSQQFQQSTQPGIYNPSNPDAGWSVTQTLAPAQQQILNSTNALNLGLMNTAGQGLGYANNVLSKPGVDTSTLPQVGINPGQTYQDAIMSRLQPQLDQQRKAFQTQMANQGISDGSEAYTNGLRDLNDQQAAQQVQATTQGFNTGLSANQNAFQQQSYNQMQPINLINALRTGSQVQQPNYVNVPQQQTTAGPDLLGAANAQYNSALAGVNARNASSAGFASGLFGLGSAGLGAYGTYSGLAAMSDRRAKKNIQAINKRNDGINIYEFEYRNGLGLPEGKQVGVMADEVEPIYPDAIVIHPTGYKMVKYDQIGGVYGR